MSAPVSAPTSSATPGAPSASTGFSSASLYVGDLTGDVTEALLFDIFNSVGQVASVRVCRDALTRKSLGYAYINYHRLEDAERALDTMNFKPIRNKPCRIMWSHRDPALRRSNVGNLFIKNLNKSIDNKQLYDTFSMFGNILSCKVSINKQTKESNGYGFVHYESEESAQNAIARVNEKVIMNNKVLVIPFKAKGDRSSPANAKFTNIFVRNLDSTVTVDELTELFSKHGKVTSCVVNNSTLNPSSTEIPSNNTIFGFINFEDSEQAKVAIAEMNGKQHKGKELYVGKAQKKEEREKEIREKFEQWRNENQKKLNNIYVKNISEDMDEAQLSELFAPFGTIIKAAIMYDQVPAVAPGSAPTKKSKGFAFVCYASSEEANKAISEMNGKMVHNKPLFVCLFQKKDERRKLLETQYHNRMAKNSMPRNGQFPNNMMMMNGMRPAYNGMGAYGNNGNMRMGGNPAGFNGGNGRNMPGNYSMMAMGNRGGMPANGMMPRGGNPAMANAQMRQQRPMMPGGNANIRPQGQMKPMPMNGQVRIVGPSQPAMAAVATAGQTAMAPAMQQMNAEPLTIKALAAAPEDKRKQMIGERLFPLIQLQERELAGKITGMLLEMDNGELIHLLESQAALNEKIQEALQVLNQHNASA